MGAILAFIRHGIPRHSSASTNPVIIDYPAMARAHTLALALLASIGSAPILQAQALPAGSVDLDSRIYAKVYISVGDALAPPYPIQGIPVLLVSASNDTIRLATDGAGATRVYLPRGPYRLLTADMGRAGGKDYRWNIPIIIAPGMRDVVLTAQNSAQLGSPTFAVSSGEVATPSTGAKIAVPPPKPPPVEYAARRRVVDSSGFVWDVFEQEFNRGAVWGTSLALPDSESLLVFNRDEETRQIAQFPKNWHSLPNDELAQLLAKAKRVRP
jgi:hypothetical protein